MHKNGIDAVCCLFLLFICRSGACFVVFFLLLPFDAIGVCLFFRAKSVLFQSFLNDTHAARDIVLISSIVCILRTETETDQQNLEKKKQ